MGKKTIYKKLCDIGKIWQQICSKCIIPFSGKDHTTEYGRFVIYHLLAGIPFNLPHFLFLNLLRMLKKIGKGMDNLHYSALINRLLDH